jgi:hypothetical protein
MITCKYTTNTKECYEAFMGANPSTCSCCCLFCIIKCKYECKHHPARSDYKSK